MDEIKGLQEQADSFTFLLHSLPQEEQAVVKKMPKEEFMLWARERFGQARAVEMAPWKDAYDRFSALVDIIPEHEPPQPEKPQEHITSRHGSSSLDTFAAAGGVMGAYGALTAKKPEIIEDDPEYQKIREEKIEEWKRNNPDKDIYATEEGLSYIYGSLDPEEKSQLEKETEEAFKTAKDENDKTGKLKYAAQIERYDKLKSKTYMDWQNKPNATKDPAVAHTQKRIKEQAEKRIALLVKANPEVEKKDIDALQKAIEKNAWERFVTEHHDKAAFYAATHEQIGEAHHRVETQKALLGKTTEMPSGAKPHPTPPAITPEQAADRLAGITRLPQAPQLVSASGAPLTLPSPPVQPLEHQPPQPPSGGGFNPIEAASSAARKRQLLNKVSKLNKLRSAAQVASNITRLLPLFGGIGFTLLIIGITFFIIVGGNQSAPGTPGTPGAGVPGAGCPDTASNRSESSCRYLNPSIDIFDTAIADANVETYINTYKSVFVGKTTNDGSIGTEAELRRRVNFIVNAAKTSGINPSMILGFWKSESNLSTYPGSRPGNDLGCRINNPEITRFDESVLCAVGRKSPGKTYEPSITVQCALSRDANSNSCKVLKQGRASAGYDSTHPIQYPIATFDDFMEAYGPYDHTDTKGLHTNCTHTYNTIFDVAKEAGMCKPQAGSPIANASCPIPNGKIGCASYGKEEPWAGFTNFCRPTTDTTTQEFNIGGHCSPQYRRNVGICLDYIKAGNLIRTAKSIDVANGSKAGDPVYMPSINGRAVQWKYLGPVDAGSGFGWIRVFQSVNASEGVWTLHFVHVNKEYALVPVQMIVSSGEIGATILSPWIKGDHYPHVHVSIGLNISGSDVFADDLHKYDPNWKFPDRDLNMCTGLTITPPPVPIAGNFIVLDPGHGSNSTEDKQKADEGKLNLFVAQKVKDLLAKEGIRAELTHAGNIPIEDHYPSLKERARRINSFGAQAFVSIHFDAENYASLKEGSRSYYNPNRPEFNQKNEILAQFVSSSISLRTGHSTKGLTSVGSADLALDSTAGGGSGPLYILGPKDELSNPPNEDSKITTPTNIPGILNEYFTKGILYNNVNTALVDKIALGYCDGILSYFKGTKKQCAGGAVAP